MLKGKAIAIWSVAAVLAATLRADLFVPENGSLELVSSLNTSTTIVAGPGSTINVTAALNDGVFNPHLVVSGGVVTVTGPATRAHYRFVSGLRAVDGGALRVGNAPLVYVGRASVASGNRNFPICDIGEVTFEAANPTGLRLRDKATARRLPTTCPVGVASGSTVAIAGNDTADRYPLLPLGVSGDFTLTDFDVIALDSKCLPEGCAVTVPPGRTFAFRGSALSADGREWNPDSGNFQVGATWRIRLGGRGARLRSSVSGGYKSRIMADVRGTGEVLFQPETGAGSTVFRGLLYRASATDPVSVPMDEEKLPALTESWKGKVALWFDASEAATVTKFAFDPNAAFGWSGAENRFEGHDIVIGWLPKTNATAGALSLYNSRIWNKYSSFPDMKGDYNLQVMPYLVEGGLNGLDYISFGTRGATKSGAKYGAGGSPASAGESRRLRVWRGESHPGDVPPDAGANYDKFLSPYCIMVFGSQQGGGRALLGSAGGADGGHVGGYLVRDDGATKPWVSSGGSDGYGITVGGFGAKPKTATPNGGWQVVSLDMSGTNTYVSGLGTPFGDSNCGGQNYAEVIFFSEKPTAEERAACEQYLAGKWGVQCSYWNDPCATLVGGGSVDLEDTTWAAYDNVDEIRVRGAYSGSINVPAGKTLVLSALPAPPGEEAVVAATNDEISLLGWYDPDYEGAATFDAATLGRGDLLNILYGRTADGLLAGPDDLMYSSGWRLSGSPATNFAPRVERSVRGWMTAGPARNWLVFADAYGDKLGNMIRSRRVGTGVNGAMNAGSDYVMQAFFAIDSSLGGGDVAGDNATFSAGVIKPRKGSDAADPIWSPSNTLEIARTWLDTAEVDGSARGYSARPEVLSFATGSSTNYAEKVTKLGYVGNWAGRNTEVVGEFIYYNSGLGDEARVAVQEYLMYKWTGYVDVEKHSDFTKATVSGAGTVRSPSLRNLPAFADGFTGTLAGGGEMGFTVDSAVDRTRALDAVDIGRAVALDNPVKVTVTVAGDGNLKPGVYSLVGAPAIWGAVASNAVLEVVNNARGRVAKLVFTDTGIMLDVKNQRTMMIFR